MGLNLCRYVATVINAAAAMTVSFLFDMTDSQLYNGSMTGAAAFAFLFLLAVFTVVGLYICGIQFPHSLTAPGFKH
jgi:hypothetical protein